MTTPITNSSTEMCSICHSPYENGEREDTNKVIELACHHFQHRYCIEEWLCTSESNKRDLNCGYCNQKMLDKKISLNYFTEEQKERSYCKEQLVFHFYKIANDCCQTPDVVRAANELNDHCNSLINIILDIEKLRLYIKNNISEDIQDLAARILQDFYYRTSVIKTLDEQIIDLSDFPEEQWPDIIPSEGLSVQDFSSDGKPFRMKVSKDWVEKATKDYIYKRNQGIPDFDRIHHKGKFETSLRIIKNSYPYDSEVINCLENVSCLREDLSNLIQTNSSLPADEILSLIKEKVIDSEIIESSKKTVPLIIDEILLRRGALRTLEEEYDKWIRIPIESWPAEMENRKIVFLTNNKLNAFKSEAFKELCIRKAPKDIIAFKSNMSKLDDVEKFEKSIDEIGRRYFYDEEVLDCLQEAKDLRQEILERFARNPNSPIECLLFYIKLAVIDKVKNSSKKSIVESIIKEVFFDRGAIRTINQEVNRWKKVPIQEWPVELRKKGVSFLDKDNSTSFLDKDNVVKQCSTNDFAKLVASQLTHDKVKLIASGFCFTLAIAATGWHFYSKK